MYRNFRIKSQSGKFYLSSPEPLEGFHKVEHNFGTSYHQEVNEVSGTLVGAEMSKPPFPGPERLKIFLENGEDIHVIEIPVTDEKDSIEQWAAEACKFLPNLNLGDELTFALNRKKKREYKGKEFLYKNMYVQHTGGDKVEWAIRREDVPEPEKKTKRDGTEKLDFTKRDDYFYSILKEQCDRLARAKDSEPEEQPKAPAYDDNLPF